MPCRARSYMGIPVISLSSRTILPWSGDMTPASMAKTVVLPGAAGAEKSDNFAAPDIQAHVFHNRPAFVRFCYVVGGEDVGKAHHSAALRSQWGTCTYQEAACGLAWCIRTNLMALSGPAGSGIVLSQTLDFLGEKIGGGRQLVVGVLASKEEAQPRGLFCDGRIDDRLHVNAIGVESIRHPAGIAPSCR